MKTPLFNSPSIARTGACFAAALILGMASAFAKPRVALDLSGKEFGTGTDLHLTSTDKLSAATAYEFKIVGTCRSTGDFEGAIPAGTPIKDVFKRNLRKGTFSNPGGTRTFVAINKKFSRTETIPGPIPVDVTFSAKIKGGATNGTVYLHIIKFEIDPDLPVTGTIKFESGSKLVISVVP